jgi:hypothetical protein
MTDNKKKFSVMKVDPVFKQEIDKIKIERIKKGFDEKIRSDRRLTMALRKYSKWSEIKEVLTKAELKDD